MMWKVTFCQQAGTLKKRNQDALFNGQRVYQYVLKKSETIEIDKENLIIGISDGVSHSPRPELASRYFMEKLQACNHLNSQWLRATHQQFCEEHCQRIFGSSCTFVAAQLSPNGQCLIMNVGDSRAYRITAQGEWIQLSYDHILLNRLTPNADQTTEYATMYYGLSDALIADHEETDFHIFILQYQLEKGDFLLLCSDGLTDDIPEHIRHTIWQKFDNIEEKLTALRQYTKGLKKRDDFSVITLLFNNYGG
ncbi:TPA: protein phosphatase 2C domain-containing protein [Pasteurella multocida]|nr:protein phosphatase 2C domain-containing protein [Pasteurella multocida]